MSFTAALTPIDHRTAKKIVQAGLVTGARVEGVENGVVVVLEIGHGENRAERLLARIQGDARSFRSIDGAASVLQELGIAEFTIDTRNWIPRTKEKDVRVSRLSFA